jgi:hypothetical protein
MGSGGGVRDQPYLQLERDGVRRERKRKETSELSGRGGQHGCGEVFVIEGDVLEGELYALEVDAGECADGSARACGMGIGSGGSLDVYIGDIADEDMGRVEAKRRDVEVLEDKLYLRVLVFDPGQAFQFIA